MNHTKIWCMHRILFFLNFLIVVLYSYLMKKIIKKIISYSQAREIIITFASNSYFPILKIWLSHISSQNINNYCVIALDKELYDLLLMKNVPVVLMEMRELITPNTKNQLWVKRIALISQLLGEGINVLHSDADAFWLKDIRKYLLPIQSDLIFSIAYAIPKDVVTAWGFILCCGFFKIRSNPRTYNLTKDFLKKCYELDDDQVAINRLLMEKGTIWALDTNFHNQGYCPAYSLTIDVLPKDIVSRQPSFDAFIYHPFLPSKEMIQKVSQATKGLEKINKINRKLR